jgi:hypothetical protein
MLRSRIDGIIDSSASNLVSIFVPAGSLLQGQLAGCDDVYGAVPDCGGDCGCQGLQMD